MTQTSLWKLQSNGKFLQCDTTRRFSDTVVLLTARHQMLSPKSSTHESLNEILPLPPVLTGFSSQLTDAQHLPQSDSTTKKSLTHHFKQPIWCCWVFISINLFQQIILIWKKGPSSMAFCLKIKTSFNFFKKSCLHMVLAPT